MNILERLVSLVFDFFMSYQRCVVGKNDVASVALVAVFVFKVVVHWPFIFCGKCFIAQLAHVLAGIVHHLPVVVTNFTSPHESSHRIFRTETVFLMRSKLGVESEPVLTVDTFNGRWYIMVAVHVRVESFLSRILEIRTLCAWKFFESHVDRLHMALDVIFKLCWESTYITNHFNKFRMMHRHVTFKAVLISERLWADLTHKTVITKVELYVSFKAQRCFALYLADLADSFAFMVKLYVAIFSWYFLERQITDEAFVVQLIRNFVFSLWWVSTGSKIKNKLINRWKWAPIQPIPDDNCGRQLYSSDAFSCYRWILINEKVEILFNVFLKLNVFSQKVGEFCRQNWLVFRLDRKLLIFDAQWQWNFSLKNLCLDVWRYHQLF